MKFYIDFDHTMFNIMKFNAERYKILEKYGISKEQQKIEETQIVETEKILINLDYTYSKISEKYNLPKEEILEEWHQIVENSHKYLYEDTIEFLEYLKNNGHELYILSWGDKKYQYKKIKGTGIEKYFDKVIITEELKFNIDIDYTSGIFIDDNPRELEGLYKNNPIEVIRIKREGAKYSEKPLNNIEVKEYKTFKDLQKELQERGI